VLLSGPPPKSLPLRQLRPGPSRQSFGKSTALLLPFCAIAGDCDTLCAFPTSRRRARADLRVRPATENENHDTNAPEKSARVGKATRPRTRSGAARVVGS